MPPSEPAHRQTPAQLQAQRAHDYPLPNDRLDELRGPLAERLRQAGVDLPPEQFDALVLDMARFALRWSKTEVTARNVAERIVQGPPTSG